MKKMIFVLGLIVVVVVGALLIPKEKTKVNYDYLRIHIRANSNSEIDQKVKYKIKDVITVPVYANGDITTPEEAKKCIEIANTDGIAVGRGVLGNPDLIYRIENYFETGQILPPPTISQKIQLLKKHIRSEIELRGELVAMQFVRKFYPYYIKGIRDAAVYRGALVAEESFEKVMDILNLIEEKESTEI